MFQKLLAYLNPLARLGKKQYSFVFPLVTSLIAALALEVYAYGIARDPNSIGLAAIFIFIAVIIYFAFRDGIQGGVIASTITILYYMYIIRTRHYVGKQETSGIETTVILGILYIFIAAVIGGLKQKIDRLIEQEANERRRLQAIVQQLPIGVMITDATGIVTQTNKELEEILGTTVEPGTPLGKELFVKRGRQNGKPVNPSQVQLMSVLATGRDIIGREFVIERPDGRERALRVNASVIKNKSGKIIAAASLITDITGEKEMETRKDDFVNMASHELKTPITSMKLYVDLLAKQIATYKDPRAEKTLGSIKNQTARLQDLVNDLLDVSRLQTGKLTFTREPFRLDELIQESVDELQQTSKHEIIYTRHPRLVVNADRFRIYQVLTNLITNAIKYSPESGKIIVSLKREDGRALVSVQDFGMGIAKNQQSKVFERLYQVSDSTTKTFPGFGMGLYISKEIVTRHKGRIWVESVKDEGSIFCFTLPIEK